MVDSDGLGGQTVETCKQLLAKFSELSIVCVGTLGNGSLSSIFGDEARVHFVEKPLSVWSVEETLTKISGVSGDGMDRQDTAGAPPVTLAASHGH
jgi:hypothetical protein